MSSLQYVVHPLPGTEDQLNERLKEVAERLNRLGASQPSALSNLGGVGIRSLACSASHIALLLEDGRVARLQYTIIPERLDLSKNDGKNGGPSTCPNPTSGTSGGTGGGASSSSRPPSSSNRQLTRARARIMRSNASVRGTSGSSNSRGGPGVIIGSSSSGVSRQMVPMPAYVPEELISQAQVVLQGKSRNLIIRELQRTNLDVNLAVNNLLSRDDEDNEEGDDASDTYVPEDLISLLDGGFHTEHSVIIDADAMFSEDMFGYSNMRNRANSSRQRSSVTDRDGNVPPASSVPTSVPTGTSAVSGGVSSGGNERENFSRWRDRQYFGSRRWLESALRDSCTWDKDPEVKKKELSASPLWLSDDLEFWPDPTLRFVSIAALYSELIAVSTTGQLHQWRWSDLEPYRHLENSNIHHPKTTQLNLLGEKIMHISASAVRCSVATESGRVATWLDEILLPASAKLEQAAQVYTEFQTDKIVSLHSCALYTVAKLESGALYWWGVLPFAQRKRLWDKFKAKCRKQKPSSAQQEITAGSLVCMKNSPMYQHGAIGFTVIGGVPKVGQLQNDAWNLTDTCRFKIISAPGIGNTQVDSKKDTSTASTSLASVGSSNISNIISGTGSSKTGVSSQKETADRIDMPPPPSPASSTCSDTGSIITKRAKRVCTISETSCGSTSDMQRCRDEEEWPMRDVIFVEDLARSAPSGRVLKVDGAYAAVKFTNAMQQQQQQEKQQQQQRSATEKDLGEQGSSSSNANNAGNAYSETATILQDCRIMRKDDLQVVKSNTTSRVPECIQRSPRRVPIVEIPGVQILTLSVDSQGIHAIVRQQCNNPIANGRGDGALCHQRLSYVIYNLSSGRVEQDSIFPSDPNAFLGGGVQTISLTNAGEGTENVLILRDGNSTIYPLAKDCTDAVREPQTLDLPPVKCLTAAILSLSTSSVGNNQLKNRAALVVLALQHQLLMPRILRCDLEGIRQILQQLESDSLRDPTILQSIVAERCDGNRNIMHACISMCAPISNKETDVLDENASGSTQTPQQIPQPNIAEESLPTLVWPSETTDATSCDDYSLLGSLGKNVSMHHSSGGGGHTGNTPNVIITDPNERRTNAIHALKTLCETPVMQPYVCELLCAKDAQGHTPFMLAVNVRAYRAANLLHDIIQRFSPAQRAEMIFPANALPDHSPLHVLCSNDTCSFTWTGAEHINQDIFECRTCGLTGSLCCCTECARVCHRGHDCKLKRTSPTAYCDCWEKCKCKALLQGNQTARYTLLQKLIADKYLVNKPNARSENILLFLAQTVGRQSSEQKQYRGARNRTSASTNRKTPSDTDQEIPDHDLEPPRFSRRALECLLNDWDAVHSMIMSGSNDSPSTTPVTTTIPNPAQQAHLKEQTGTTFLDKFTHSLLVKCSLEMLDVLLQTIIREICDQSTPGRSSEAEIIARRFVRSVARIFVIFSVEMAPNTSKRKSYSTSAQPLSKCRRVFRALVTLAIEELCEIADSLIAPVRLGVARPTAPFTLAATTNDVLNGSEELFCVEPMSLSSTRNNMTSQNANIATRASRNVNDADANGDGNLADVAAPLIDDTHDDESMAVDNDDDNVSEHEDSTSGDPSSGIGRQEVVVIDNQGPRARRTHQFSDSINIAGEDSDPELDLLVEAETESDSDDNQSNQEAASAQRSVQTGATAGTDTEDESGESSQQEEEESDAAETDEQDTEEFTLHDEQLERRNNNFAHGHRSNLAPPSMQWAIRSRDQNTRGTAGVRISTGSNLVFIDSTSLRRSASQSTAAAVAAAAASAGNAEPVTMSTTSACLARAFGIVVRQISDLLTMLQQYSGCHSTASGNAPATIEFNDQEVVNLQVYLEMQLRPTWDWLMTVMDTTEAQLRFGASLTNASDPAHPSHPLHSTNTAANSSTSNNQSSNPVLTSRTNRRDVPTSLAASGTHPSSSAAFDAHSTRREFLSYCLSLMRAHNAEHLDSLPILDVSSLKHVAYVFDALIYYMRSGSSVAAGPIVDQSTDSDLLHDIYPPPAAWNDQDENDNEEPEDDIIVHSVAMETDSVEDQESNYCNVSTCATAPVPGLLGSQLTSTLAPPSKGRKHPFFQRSDSTLCLGCPPPDPFETPVAEALPLADQPHLLQPNSRREELFGIQKQPTTVTTQNIFYETIPTHLGLSVRNDSKSFADSNGQSDRQAFVSTANEPSRANDTNTGNQMSTNQTSAAFSNSSASTSHAQSENDQPMTEIDKKPTEVKVRLRNDVIPTPIADVPVAPIAMEVTKPYKKRNSFTVQINSTPNVSVTTIAASTPLTIDSMAMSRDDSPSPSSSSRPQIIISPRRSTPIDTNALFPTNLPTASITDALVNPTPTVLPIPSAPGDIDIQRTDLNETPTMAGFRTLETTLSASTSSTIPGFIGAGTTVTPVVSVSMSADVVDESSSDLLSTQSNRPIQILSPAVINALESSLVTTPSTPQLKNSGAAKHSLTLPSQIQSQLPLQSQLSQLQSHHSGLQARLPIKSVIVRAGTSTASESATPSPLSYDDKGTKDVDHEELIEVKPASQKDDLQQTLPSTSSAFQMRPSTLKYGTSTTLAHRDVFLCQSISHDLLLGRWRLALDLFGRVFMEDVGLEPGSIVSELGGFPVKEAKFRRDMEKLRNAQARDLQLHKIDRERTTLILQTFKELNTQYQNFSRRPSVTQPPLAVNRVKVTFRDEPGEGSGVARSFYTAIAEALLSNEKLPPLESVAPSCSTSTTNKYVHVHTVLQRLQTRSRDQGARASVYGSRAPTSSGTGGNTTASLVSNQSATPLGGGASMIIGRPPRVQRERRMTIYEPNSPPTTLHDHNSAPTDNTINDLDVFSLTDRSSNNKRSSSGAVRGAVPTDPSTPATDETPEEGEDNNPLFYCPGKQGYYSPRLGKVTFERLNAFRNVGRLLGLCLLQNELCPIFLQRHVLKYILGRQCRFHDLAFFDSTIYESLRMMVHYADDKNPNNLFNTLDLTFNIDLPAEEGGGTHDLIPNGQNVEVNVSNICDYVRKYAEYRMVKSQERALESIKAGVFDVLPEGSLDGLTSEDLRLLLNGVGDINVSVLISYTSFNDESNESSERLVKFKRWLWSIVEKMTHVERQDLVYFWTGSPALPASEDGFQPMPSVTIRPADDSHLPTANTCISRLYIPLYSSRSVLRSKLLMAIKTKNFGFV